MSNSNQLTAQISSKTESNCHCGQLNGTGADRLIEYTENTTIHGIKYLGEKQRPIIGKIFWIVIFVVSFIILGFFVQDVLQKFNQKSAILVEDDRPTPIHSIPFPAVTICPAVKIKNIFLPPVEVQKWLSGESKDSMVLDLAYLICNQQFLTVLQNVVHRNITQYLNQSHIELLHMISPSIRETFHNIEFASTKEFMKSKADPLSYVLTNEGLCATFNVPSEIITDALSLQTEYKYHNIQNKSKSWHNDYGYSGYPRYPRAVWGSGPSNGLRMIMLAFISDLNTFCQPTQIGYKIKVHSPDEYPTTLDKFIPMPHNTLAQIKITPKIIKTSNELRNLNPLVRQCFFDHERKLKYFTYYNRVNCKLECLANYSQQQYGCVHFSLPRNHSQAICGTGVKVSKIFDTEEIISSYFQYKTEIIDMYEAELEDDEPIDFIKFSNFHCNCLPACNSVEYEYRVEMENFELEKLRQQYFPQLERENTAAVMIDFFF